MELSAGSIPDGGTEPPCVYNPPTHGEKYAVIAQMVELLICNQWVAGSSPAGSSSPPERFGTGGFMAEWRRW